MTRIRNVRNTIKFKRSIKAISPVIATLLMIAIAVVASLVVYAWVTGYIGGTTSTAGKAIQIQSFASDPTTGNLVIYVQNVGQGDVELNQDQSVYVDSNLVSITTPAQVKIPITIGQTVELLTDHPYTAGTKVTIKVTTTDGTFMTTTGTGSSGSANPTTPVVTYAVDFMLGSGGLSMNPADGPHNVGGDTAISATPSTGYHFTSWTSTGSITFADASAASTTATVSGAGSITANFEADTVYYNIVVTQNANGAITPAGTTSYAAGSTPSFTITPDSSYHIASITANGNPVTVTTPAGQSYQFAALSADGTLIATFAQDTPTMHVSSITMSVYSPYNNHERGRGIVTIVDSSGNPVYGATVYGTWTGTGATTVSGTTDSNGHVTLESNTVNSGYNTYTLTITNVVKSGWTYDSSANIITTKSVSG